MLFSAGALLYVPGDTLAGSELPHFDYVLAVFGEPGLIFLTVAVITATCSTLNTSLASISRIVYGMAHNGQFFSVFKTVHPKYQTPWPAILFVAFLSVSPIIFGAGLDRLSFSLPVRPFPGCWLMLLLTSMWWYCAKSWLTIHSNTIEWQTNSCILC